MVYFYCAIFCRAHSSVLKENWLSRSTIWRLDLVWALALGERLPRSKLVNVFQTRCVLCYFARSDATMVCALFRFGGNVGGILNNYPSGKVGRAKGKNKNACRCPGAVSVIAGVFVEFHRNVPSSPPRSNFSFCVAVIFLSGVRSLWSRRPAPK